MSLKPAGDCTQCGLTLSYVDDKGVIFSSNIEHGKNECALQMKETIKSLRNRVLELVNERPKIIKAPKGQEAKLIDQCHRWQAMYERERYRRWALKNQIMKVYGTLDFRVETGAIVDVNAKSVAEYVSVKLRELIRNSTK